MSFISTLFDRAAARTRLAIGTAAMRVAASSAGIGGLEGARMARRLAGFTPARSHINTLLTFTGNTLLARVRFLHRNNAYAESMVDCFAGTLIGNGFKARWVLDDDDEETTTAPAADRKVSLRHNGGPPLNPKSAPTPAPAAPVTPPIDPAVAAKKKANDVLRKKLQKLWTRWTNAADADGNYDFEGMLWLGAVELFLAGEFFIRKRPRRIDDVDRNGNVLPVPLQLQFLPAEMLDLTHNVDLGGGGSVRQGIEFDAIGRRRAYHFWRAHPGDSTIMVGGGEKTVVPADQVIHVRVVKEAGQIRGLSRMASLVVPLWALDCYEDAELERKRVAALFTVFITRGLGGASGGTIMTDAETKAANVDGKGIGNVELSPGAVIITESGEDVKTAAPADVGNNFEPFIYRAILKLAAGAGLPYSGVSGDPSKSNYANAKSMLVDLRRRFEGVQNHVLIFQLCQALIPAWLDAAVLGGRIDLPGYTKDNPEGMARYQNVTWTPDAFEWSDPLKDAQRDQILVNMRAKARSQVVEERGDDPIENDDRIAEDQTRLKEKGIDPPIGTPTDANAQGGAAQAPDGQNAQNDQPNGNQQGGGNDQQPQQGAN